MYPPSTLIGIPELDVEHQYLFETVANLQTATSERDAFCVRFLLEEAVSHTVRHFEHEERLMCDAAYAGRDWHRRQHAAALKQISRFLGPARRTADAAPLLAYLADWLPVHIALHDRMMAAALRNARRIRTFPGISYQSPSSLSHRELAVITR